ncbi:aldehyde dehydrogenase [Lentithecium fluviatile CBS 122367]|uniref:Aldehyde dehydrogenase n=1 Tax=Lentithecium fluviatile CBS 122367 TaxID=1168545 RepID=A0A6G1J1B8_9PLEO|nr:aldehyde dehydrogenase [Lentithecium fluviatile CBS 122367]
MVFIQPDHSPNGLPVVPLWIDGAAHEPSATNSFFPVTSSLQGRAIHNAVSATPSIATLACDAAAKAFSNWRKTAPSHRRALLLEAAGVIDVKAKEIAEWQVAETSCPEQFAVMNVKMGAVWMREIAAATSEIRGVVPQRSEGPDGTEMGGLNIVVREPIGVVLIIPPWNGAVVLPVRAISMALAAGCTIVVKASELCPRTHHLLIECFEEAGIPAGVINVIQAARSDAAAVTEAIVAHKAVRKVDFIGSAAVGSKIGQLCAKYLKPILMELGGKGPAIVLDDADLEKAARLCSMGAIVHHGQLCFSTERIIVHKAIYTPFTTLLTAIFSKIPSAGNAVHKAATDHAMVLLQEAQQKGAEVLTGGLEYLSETSLKPTLITGVTKDMRIADEETFGPSAAVYIAEDDEEAVRLANDSKYGLNAAVHSKSWEHAYEVARQLEYGQVHINNVTCTDSPGAPIQGVKGSGWGQSNSIWGIREFSVEKTVCFHPTGAGGFPSV